MERYILAMDQGTSSSRAMLFDAKGQSIATAQRALPQEYPAAGWVEQDAETIWQDVLACAREVASGKTGQIAGIGITNQRETCLIWQRSTGKPLGKAIVWQDSRTADFCTELQAQGHETLLTERTGLLASPYFSASKLRWMLENIAGARELAAVGDLCAGTIDSWLIWKLTGGKRHVTDVTNASRTLLFNIHSLQWDADLCALFDVPTGILPEVLECADDFGVTAAEWFGAEIPICGVAGDQQAAFIGQGCFTVGDVKATYGTGCFVLMNIGEKPVISRHRLLTTLGYKIQGKRCYALEGAVFIAGAAVQWLRDGMGMIAHASEMEGLAASVADSGGVYFVPAFVGLGAPYWDAGAHGALLGLRRESGKAEIARAALEAQAFQSRDLIEAMQQDSGSAVVSLRVDGGMVANSLMCQILANQLAVAVLRPQMVETTILGAAALAALGSGVVLRLEDFLAGVWAQGVTRFETNETKETRENAYRGWQDSVRRVRSVQA